MCVNQIKECVTSRIMQRTSIVDYSAPFSRVVVVDFPPAILTDAVVALGHITFV